MARPEAWVAQPEAQPEARPEALVARPEALVAQPGARPEALVAQPEARIPLALSPARQAPLVFQIRLESYVPQLARLQALEY